MEFREHSDALLVLRRLSTVDNAEIFGLPPEQTDTVNLLRGTKQWQKGGQKGKNTEKEKEAQRTKMGKLLVEFAVEDMKRLNVHLEKMKRHRLISRKQNIEEMRDQLEAATEKKQWKEVAELRRKIRFTERTMLKEATLQQKETRNRMERQKSKQLRFQNNRKGKGAAGSKHAFGKKMELFRTKRHLQKMDKKKIKGRKWGIKRG